MIKAIFFDFNGVIIDDEPLHEKSFREILKAENVALTAEDYRASFGMDDRSFVKAAYQRAGQNIDDETISGISERKSALYQSYIADQIPTFDGIIDFIKRVSVEFPLGIVSMSRRAEIETVLKRLGISENFSLIVSADEVNVCKPDPLCYRTAFRLMDELRTARGSNPMAQSDCLVIEDAPPGVRAGKAAGMKVLGVTNTVSAQELRQAGADSVTKSLADWFPDTIRLVFKPTV